jgi:hypothetical protein
MISDDFVFPPWMDKRIVRSARAHLHNAEIELRFLTDLALECVRRAMSRKDSPLFR